MPARPRTPPRPREFPADLSTLIVCELLAGFAVRITPHGFLKDQALPLVETFGMSFALSGSLAHGYLYPVDGDRVAPRAVLVVDHGRLYRLPVKAVDGPLGSVAAGDLTFVLPWRGATTATAEDRAAARELLEKRARALRRERLAAARRALDAHIRTPKLRR